MNTELWSLLNIGSLSLAVDSHTESTQAESSSIICSCGGNYTFQNNIRICVKCCASEEFHQETSNVDYFVFSSHGRLISRERKEYDRTETIKKMYVTILKKGSIELDDLLIDASAQYVVQAQQMSTNNRGQRLRNLMAGALAFALQKDGQDFAEIDIARLFRTAGGISSGRNSLTTNIARGMFKNKDSTYSINCFKEAAGMIGNKIRCRMAKHGLNPTNSDLYHFIKSIALIDKLFGYVDNQIIACKISAAIYIYLRYYDPESTINRLSDMKTQMDITVDTVQKFVTKLHLANKAIVLLSNAFKIRQVRPFDKV